MNEASLDMHRAALQWRQWGYMALNDIKMHYRRSVLGPLWFSLNTLIMVGSLGAVYSLLFGMSATEYIPYFATGYLAWQLIASFFGEGAQTFIQHAGMIKNVNVPLSFFAMKVTTKLMIVFLHQCVVLIPVLLFFPIDLTFNVLWVFPAVILYAVNGFALCVLIGMISARYRDMPNLISNFLQICFFITPIFWPASSISQSLIIRMNIFYHLIELFRAPLLGHTPTIEHWLVSGAVTLLVVSAAYCVFGHYRTRIVHTL